MNVIAGFSGHFAALLAAFLWAFCSVLFKDLGHSIKPVELNLIKGIGAIGLLAFTSLLLGENLSLISSQAILLLLLSGAVGIGFGDTMYFEAINCIGPNRSLLLATLAPIITAVLALIFLGEKIVPLAWLGVAITLMGILLVITQKHDSINGSAKNDRTGILFALLFAFAQAAGAVISRWALTQTSITPLQSSVVRIFAGIVFLFGWIAITRTRLGGWMKPGNVNAKSWLKVSLVVLLGAYLPLWLQQVAFKNTEVGIAQTLLATAPIFILPISALQKEKISLREIFGMVISVAGIAVLFLVH